MQWEHRGGRYASWKLGGPLTSGCIARMLDRLVESAKVKRISVHGLRHTSATLLLGAGVPFHVVQQRLGHSKSSTTLDIYAHVLPTQQQDAAGKLGSLLHG